MFNYEVDQSELDYMIKWTLIKHAQYIINELGLSDGDPSGGAMFVPNSNVYDVISNSYNNLPAIACDYQGSVLEASVVTEYVDLFEIRYRGLTLSIQPLSRFGVKSENRDLLLIHAAIRDNFKRLSDENRLEIYSFNDEGREPVDTGHRFHASLLESNFAETNDSSRANGINWIFRVTLDI